MLGLDTLGGGTPIVLTEEATLLRQRLSRGGPRAGRGRRGPRGRHAGPQRWRLGTWTDPILACFAGLPAVSILAMGEGYLPEHHLMSDTPSNVDWASVEACIRIALGTAAVYAPGPFTTPD